MSDNVKRTAKGAENVSTNGMLRLGDDRDIVVRDIEIEVDNVLKLKPLYENAYYFVTEEGFTHPQTNDDKIEDLYWERWVPSGAKEQHVWWRLKKDINNYIRYFIVLNFQTLNVTKKEATWKGKKLDLEKTDLIIRIRFVLQFDVKNLFKDSMAWKFRKIFFNRVYNEEIEQEKENLWRLSMKFERFFKQYLNVPADEDAPADLFDPMGYQTRN